MFSLKIPLFTSSEGVQTPKPSYNFGFIFCGFALSLLGLLMVASTSMNIAAVKFNDPLYYFWRQSIYSLVGLILAMLVLQFPLKLWQRINISLLFIGIALLILVVIPHIGREVNGSMRWISLGFFNLQPSEPMKLFIILFMAGYLIRRSVEVRAAMSGFIKPMLVVCVITCLLLLEPDYGATVVLFVTVLGMLFLAGVPMRQFLLWVTVVGLALGLVLLIAPYRIGRLASFMNPWADPFNKGFQLIQALIAIGRGELFGVGLGNSVQKLSYLPEAHTDFLFAILAEEFGLIGVVLVIGLFAWLVLRAFTVAMQAERLGLHYAAYVSYGIGLAIGLQAGINLGVNMGLLPTKGLTLPFMSYGGSSMLIACVMLAILIRIDYENQLAVFPKRGV